VGKSTIYAWRRAYRKSGNRQITQPISAEQKRIRQVEKELTHAKLERDILKKAVRIFSKND
jgi:transposase-like protein